MNKLDLDGMVSCKVSLSVSAIVHELIFKSVFLKNGYDFFSFFLVFKYLNELVVKTYSVSVIRV